MHWYLNTIEVSKFKGVFKYGYQMPVTVFKYYLKLRYLNTVLNNVVALTPCIKLTTKLHDCNTSQKITNRITKTTDLQWANNGDYTFDGEAEYE